MTLAAVPNGPDVSFLPKENDENKRRNPLFSSLADALDSEEASVDWFCEGIVGPQITTLLAGAPKAAGKTTFAFGLIAALASGGTFLGRECTPTGVLLLSEERVPSLADKDRRWRISGHSNVHVGMRHNFSDLDWPLIVDAAVDHCIGNELGLLVVDVWDKWTGIADENDSATTNHAFLPLAAAASRGIGVLLIHHHRKSAGANGDRIRGSNALLGSVDVALELERLQQAQADDKPRRMLRGEGRFSAIPSELLIELTDDGYISLGSDVRQVKQDHDRQVVLDRIGDEDGPTIDKLAADTEIPVGRVRKIVAALDRDEEIKSTASSGRGAARRYWTVSFFSAHPLGREETSLLEDWAA